MYDAIKYIQIYIYICNKSVYNKSVLYTGLDSDDIGAVRGIAAFEVGGGGHEFNGVVVMMERTPP